MIGKFERAEGPANIKPYKKKASTAFSWGDPVYVDSNGFLDVAVAATAAADIVGVIQETIASTDDDYASTRMVAVDVPRKGDNGDLFRAQVGTGTAAQTDVGELVDLTAGSKVDLDASSIDALKVQRILSTTEVLVSFM